MDFQIEKIHHVAYRCHNAKETVAWYKEMLGMDFILAFAEDHVPSTKAFFELPTQPDMGRDENTPKWVQHLAMKVKDRPTLEAAKAHLESKGVDVLGITNHGIFHSIYFFDPNGHRIELAYDDEKAMEKIARITEEMKVEMLNEWDSTKRAPHHTHFLHADELDESKA